MAEIRPTLYSSELQKMLYPDNSFMNRAVRERGVAPDVKTIEKPVQGSIKKAKEGEPSTLPLQIYNPSDGKHSYDTTLIYCDPILIDSQSELLVNYNKRQSKQEQQASELMTKAAAYTLNHWAPTNAVNLVKTTGTARASNVKGFSSNRKAVTKEDMLKIHNLMMRMNVSSLGGSWYGMVTPDMYTDLLGISDFIDYYKTGNETGLRTGAVGRILGIDIFVRTNDNQHAGILYNASDVPQDGDTEPTDALLAGGLFWNDRLVCIAQGTPHICINENKAEYLGGTLMSCWMRHGADILRDDQKGVIALLEAK